MKRNIIIAVAVIAGILAAVAIISILAQTPAPIWRVEDSPEFGCASMGEDAPKNRGSGAGRYNDKDYFMRQTDQEGYVDMMPEWSKIKKMKKTVDFCPGIWYYNTRLERQGKTY